MTTRFIGTIDAKVDSKGRVFLPATFRRTLQGSAEGVSSGGKDSGKCETRLIMRKDVFEDCLVLFSEQVWWERLDQLRSRLSLWNREDQSLMRKYVSDAEWLTLDSNGRFLIPKRYLRMAGIEGDVTFVGMDTTIEVWSPTRLSQQPTDHDLADKIERLCGRP